MLITQPSLSSIFFNLRLDFAQGMKRADPWWKQVATEVPSSTRENRYAWLSALPRLREWLGERILRNISANEYALKNRKFEDSFAIERDDIEDDNLGLYANSASQLGEQVVYWPQDLIVEALLANSGAGPIAYDGQNFFNASHPVSPTGVVSGTYSNLYTSTPLSSENWESVRAAMALIAGEDGRPMRVRPDLILCGPALEGLANRIFAAELLNTVYGANTAAAAQSNVNRGAARVLVVPDITDLSWYPMDTTKGIMPFIFQNRRGANLVSFTSTQDETVFYKSKFVYGVDVRGAVGVTLPFLMAKCTP